MNDQTNAQANTTPQDDARHSPLPPEQAQRLEAIGVRIQEHSKAIFHALPEDARTANAVSKEFKIEGVVARRLVRLVAGTPGLVSLTRMPSIEHYRGFANLMKFRSVESEHCDKLLDALDDLQEEQRNVGGAKARLTKRIRATIAEAGGPQDESDA